MFEKNELVAIQFQKWAEENKIGQGDTGKSPLQCFLKSPFSPGSTGFQLSSPLALLEVMISIATPWYKQISAWVTRPPGDLLWFSYFSNSHLCSLFKLQLAPSLFVRLCLTGAPGKAGLWTTLYPAEGGPGRTGAGKLNILPHGLHAPLSSGFCTWIIHYIGCDSTIGDCPFLSLMPKCQATHQFLNGEWKG